VPSPTTGSGRTASLPRPTRTAAILFSFAILLELLGRLVGSTAITIAAAAALGAVIGDAALTPRLDGITLTRRSPNRLTTGVVAPVRLVLTQPRRRRSEHCAILLTDDFPGLVPTSVLIPEIPRALGECVAVPFEVIPQHRGYWEARGEDLLEVHSPLGGFVRRSRLGFTAARWVHPAPASPLPLPDVALGAQSLAAGSGSRGQGTEFYGIREWRSGDGSASVHWRASARRNQLIVMERERPAQGALAILVGPANPGPDWERMVSRGASTAVEAARQGRTLTLVCGEESATPATRRDILDWFAALDETPPADHLALTRVLRRSGAGTTVLWLATSEPPAEVASLTRAAAATLVVARAENPAQVQT
jgi:uncharacterized protein (DUF58 family)